MPRRKAIVQTGRATDEGPARLIEAEVAALREIVAELRERIVSLETAVKAGASEDRLALIVFSGSLDRQIAAFAMATAAAASGMQVDMYFTSRGLGALRDPAKCPRNQGLPARLFGRLLPRGFGDLARSTSRFGGLGAALIPRRTRDERVASLEEMLRISADLGVRLWICDLSRELLGVPGDDLVDHPHLDRCDVAHFLGQASRSKVSLVV